MLPLRRSARDARTGASLTTVDFLHSSFRVRLTESVGATLDEALLYPVIGWTGPATRPQLVVVLGGRSRCTEQGVARWLEPGSFAVGSCLETLFARVEADTLSLGIDWKLGSVGTRPPSGLPSGSLSASARARVTDLAAHLFTKDIPDARACVADLLAVLRSEGIPLDPISEADLVEPIDPQEEAVARALSDSLSCLTENPHSVDLERRLGRSRRCVTDLVTRFASRFGLNGGDWRTFRDRWRLLSGAALTTHPKARTEDIASALGYGSARAFCHVFHRAGLPSPINVRRAVDALR